MPAFQGSRAADKESRKRRTHTKSRRGCGNCKLRRVKCDESRPCCKRCRTFGVSCSYDGASTDPLHQFEEVSFAVGSPQATAPSMNQTILGVVNESLSRQSPGGKALKLCTRDLETLNRYSERTCLTLGNTNTRSVFRNTTLWLAFQHPFLMHATLTLTLMHDRADSLNPEPSAMELYHYCETTSQFARKLTESLSSSERDALWLTSSIIGCMSLGQVVGDTPEDVWPLSPPAQVDLSWLKLGEGKKVVWEIVDPYRPDSLLQPLTVHPRGGDDFITKPLDPRLFESLPPELAELCGLNKDSSPKTNPFHVAGAVLARLMPVAFSQEHLIKFLGFLTLMPPEFRDLLMAKDYRAILILAHYIAKLRGSSPWWSSRRLQLECEAMCRYLERFYSHIPNMEKLLDFPRTHKVNESRESSPGSWYTEASPLDSDPGNTRVIPFVNGF